MVGKIKALKQDKLFGFIGMPDALDTFFHANDLAVGIAFDGLNVGQEIEFDRQQTEKGWRASNVRPVSEPAPKGYLQ